MAMMLLLIVTTPLRFANAAPMMAAWQLQRILRLCVLMERANVTQRLTPAREVKYVLARNVWLQMLSVETPLLHVPKMRYVIVTSANVLTQVTSRVLLAQEILEANIVTKLQPHQLVNVQLMQIHAPEIYWPQTVMLLLANANVLLEMTAVQQIAAHYALIKNVCVVP